MPFQSWAVFETQCMTGSRAVRVLCYPEEGDHALTFELQRQQAAERVCVCVCVRACVHVDVI